MSKKRQDAIFDQVRDRRSTVVTLTQDYPAGYAVPMHFHDRDQLVYASRGVMTVRTSQGTWVVPTHRAVWIPEAVPHCIAMSGKVEMRTLYLKRGLAKFLPRDCCVVNVAPLLRELILHACQFGTLRGRVRLHARVIEILLDQLKVIQVVPLQLPNVSDARALRIASILLADPGNRQPLARLCKRSGASRRTVERLFEAEVRMTFGKWRQQLKLMEGMRLLGEGAKVTHAALEAGYSTPSAFIAAFRKTLGTTPAMYFKMSAWAGRDPR
jgi:AraC-like DNA-binding protein